MRGRQMIDNPQSNPLFSDFCIEREVAASYERVYAAETQLLQVILGKDASTGLSVPWWGRAIAEAQGVTLGSFLHSDNRLAWNIAQKSKALELLRLADETHEFNVGRVKVLLSGTFSYNSVLRAVWPLQDLLAREKEARLCFTRGRALLNGGIAPQAVITFEEMSDE